MKIQVKNLGIINNGIIDLNNPLTVFCGPNGTGKTYLSYLIFALVSDKFTPMQPLSNEEIDELAEKGSVSIPVSEENALSFRKRTIEILKSRLNEIFGLSKKNSSQLFKNFEFSFLSTDKDFLTSIRKMSITININYLGNFYKIEKKRGKMEYRLRRDKRQTIANEAFQAIRYLTSSLLYQRFLTHGISTASIFTVERSSIFTFHKELLLSRSKFIDLIQDKISRDEYNETNLTNLFEQNSNRYPLAIRQNIQFAADLTQIKKEDSPYSLFADEIEKKLLNGNHVDVDSDGNIYIQVEKNVNLPIHMGASVAKTLAPLILTLRHRTNNGDLLIIDEPELNLHPKAQILLARLLVRMINKGLKILISTHSDYIIKEINNMIMWGEVDNKVKKVFKESSYAAAETIKANQVGVYVFNYSNSSNVEGVLIEPVIVNKMGFEIKAMDEVIRVLNDTGEDAYSALISLREK